ncbi:MAG: hypothetical protein M3137_14005, partial [Actinomycetota bacterium]|nr:hypothetical protein [Actinomycetota bacterium]
MSERAWEDTGALAGPPWSQPGAQGPTSPTGRWSPPGTAIPTGRATSGEGTLLITVVAPGGG